MLQFYLYDDFNILTVTFLELFLYMLCDNAKFQGLVNAATLSCHKASTERLAEEPTRKRSLFICLLVCSFCQSMRCISKKSTDPRNRHDDKLTGQIEGVCLSSERTAPS